MHEVNEIRSTLVSYYNTSAGYFSDLKAKKDDYFRRYVEFVSSQVAPDALVLDVGCGNGTSSVMLQKKGYRVVGCDISRLFLSESHAHIANRLAFSVADAGRLPFSEGVFDAVCSFLFIEHAVNVDKILLEMARVTKANGRVIIICPNLCSIQIAFTDLSNLLLGGKGRPVWSPNIPKAITWFLKNSVLAVRKLLSSRCEFLYRQPDLTESVIGVDTDSVYLAHPIDIRRFLRCNGFIVKRKRVNFLFLDDLISCFDSSIDIVAIKKDRS
jgi:SAM-dependent methyltransferase